MHTHQTVFTLVTFLHDLCTAIWIGGLITLVVGVLPAVRKMLGQDEKSQQLAAAIQKRQSSLVYFSIIGLAVTGFLLSKRSPDFDGLLSFTNSFAVALSIKHILMILMVAITLFRSLVLNKRVRWLKPAQQKNWRKVLLFGNLAAGIATLLLSSLLVALSSG